MVSMTCIVLAVLVILVLPVASRGGSKQTPTQSGVFGIALFTDGAYFPSPSPLPSGFGTNADQGKLHPYVTVQIEGALGTANSGKVVARVKPDSQALFKVSLPPASTSSSLLSLVNRPGSCGGSVSRIIASWRMRGLDVHPDSEDLGAPG